MNYVDTLQYLKDNDLTMSRYEREEWDRFVKKTKLNIEIPFIHITGSNGKGSSANYLYEVYKAAGYKVALFSKPYLKKPNEMIRIDGKDISDDDFARIFSQRENEFRKFGLSSFEVETAMAFDYFNEQKPDLAIIECGMGGETDSTNLSDAKPALSIITTVSLEHTAFLGRTTSELARNKAAIIKDKCPVLVGPMDEDLIKVIRDIAERRDSEFFQVDAYHNSHYEAPYLYFDYRPYQKLQLLTPALYQLKNASVVVEATKILNEKFPVTEEAVRKGLLSSPLPCRFERHRNIFIDGAHNPQAINELVESLIPLSGEKPIHVVFASFRDKNIAVELPRIGRDAAEIVLTTFDSKRARDESDYFLYAEDYSYNPDYKLAISDFLIKYPDDIILITGSLAFANLAREYVIETLHL